MSLKDAASCHPVYMYTDGEAASALCSLEVAVLSFLPAPRSCPVYTSCDYKYKDVPKYAKVSIDIYIYIYSLYNKC